MTQSTPNYPAVPVPPEPQPVPKPKRFGGMSIAALVLGIIALCGSPIPILNNATIIAGFIGVVFAIIGLFGWRKVMAGIAAALAVAGIAIGLVLQAQWGRELDQIGNQLSGSTPVLPNPTTQAAGANNDGQPATNAQGYISKQVGETAGLSSPDGSGQSTFTIDKITVDPKCYAYGAKPDAGHTLLLDVRVATGTDGDVAQDLSGTLNPYSFQFVGADGVTRQVQAGTCTDWSKSLSTAGFGPNQKYAGTIELVVPDAHGTLRTGRPAMSSGDSPAGWEWKY